MSNGATRVAAALLLAALLGCSGNSDKEKRDSSQPRTEISATGSTDGADREFTLTFGEGHARTAGYYVEARSGDEWKKVGLALPARDSVDASFLPMPAVQRGLSTEKPVDKIVIPSLYLTAQSRLCIDFVKEKEQCIALPS